MREIFKEMDKVGVAETEEREGSSVLKTEAVGEDDQSGMDEKEVNVRPESYTRDMEVETSKRSPERKTDIVTKSNIVPDIKMDVNPGGKREAGESEEL